MTAEIAINRELDVTAGAARYAATGRVQIADLLTPASADRVYEAIRSNEDWYLAYTENGQGIESPAREIQRLSPAQRQQFMNAIHQRAAEHFQYCFLQYYISECVGRGEDPGHALHALHDFVNDEPFLEVMRTVTGVKEIKSADVLASCYGPGHYLNAHDDTHPDRSRVAAFVISLTKDWNRNWGGHLAFFDAAGNVEEAIIPCFNALNVFSVPQFHSVQLVAPFARAARTSLTGWVHR